MNLWECPCDHCRSWRIVVRVSAASVQAQLDGRDPEQMYLDLGPLPEDVHHTVAGSLDALQANDTAERIAEAIRQFREKSKDHG